MLAPSRRCSAGRQYLSGQRGRIAHGRRGAAEKLRAGKRRVFPAPQSGLCKALIGEVQFPPDIPVDSREELEMGSRGRIAVRRETLRTAAQRGGAGAAWPERIVARTGGRRFWPNSSHSTRPLAPR